MAALLLLFAASERPAAHDPITTKITFAREIRAILSARCATCHSPGGPAPMPLTTYENVRPWARAIKEQVLDRRMPKWHAARGFGSFTNDPTLTPIEIAMIVSWVDGGLPFSTSSPRVASPVPYAPGASASSAGASASTSTQASASSSTPVVSSFPVRRSLGEGGRRKIGIPILRIPAGKNEGVARVRAQWVSGWSFEPGDPLTTSATFTLADGTVVGSWVAGDDPVRLPANSAIRISSSLRVRVQRRAPADYEEPYKARASVLRLVTRTTAPTRRAWVERIGCGSPWTGRPAQVLAIRPMIEDGGAARIWIERGGAAKTVIGWFRDFDTRFPRTYWLTRPADFSTEARLSSSERCEAMLTLVALR